MSRMSLELAGRAAGRMAGAVEGADGLDRLAAPVRRLALRALRPGRMRDLLSGTPIGHPAHPALVAVPLGCWSSGVIAGLAGERRAARLLTGAGVLAAVPTMATGLSDWVDTDGAEQRVGLVHMAANSVAVTLFALSWRGRARGSDTAATVLSVAGLSAGALGGWLGGHLAYGLGVGVDTNSFEGGPTDWTSVEERPSESDGERLRTARAAGVGLVVARPDGEEAAVLANRCSHRGGPLSEGELAGGCVRCPWHGSEFEVRSGRVVRGPATVDQPAYEVRRSGPDLEVRRSEPRALRLNSARP